MTLKHAAEVLWKRYYRVWQGAAEGKGFKTSEPILLDLRLVGPALLLTGLALENLAKAVRVALNQDVPSIISDGHKLGKHFDQAQIQLTQRQHDILRDLTKAIEWSGKYPTSKRELNRKNRHIPFPVLQAGEVFNDKNILAILTRNGEEIEEIWEKAAERLRAIGKRTP